jgi:TPR repeat protein
MKHPLQLIGAVCLLATLIFGCDVEDGSDVENSESAATTLKQSEAAARKGDHHEMMNVGMTYYQGPEDVKQDNLKAYIWLTLAAENEELKNAGSLVDALADLKKTLSSADKNNALMQIDAIKVGLPKD